jgi:hypothetical protein
MKSHHQLTIAATQRHVNSRWRISDEGQRRKTHAAEAGETLDAAASYNAETAAG